MLTCNNIGDERIWRRNEGEFFGGDSVFCEGACRSQSNGQGVGLLGLDSRRQRSGRENAKVQPA